jgi:uncharacterized protein YbjT (DUF2867 family)
MIILAGGSRGVGREVAERLAARGDAVCALVRQPSQASDLEALGIQTVLGDAADSEAIASLFRQAGRARAVISTLGGLSPSGERIDFFGNKHLVDAALRAEVNQFILVSSIGVGNSRQALTAETYAVLAPALIEKEKAEAYLINSGLTYTIIRPGGLKSEAPTGRGVLTLDPSTAGLIHRADVAELILACLQSPRSHRQVFSALDSHMIRGDQPLQPYPLA